MKYVFGYTVGAVAFLLLGVLFYTTLLGIGAVTVYVLTTAPWWVNVIGIILGCVCAGGYVTTSMAHREKHIQINEVLELDDD